MGTHRHVPITTWEANLKFRSLDESQRGKMLAVEGEVVDRLEAIRSIVMDPTQVRNFRPVQLFVEGVRVRTRAPRDW